MSTAYEYESKTFLIFWSNLIVNENKDYKISNCVIDWEKEIGEFFRQHLEKF